MLGIASLGDHFYRRAHEANMSEALALEQWNAFSTMMDSWFTLEELQDNQLLLKNVKLMILVISILAPIPFERREDRVIRMSAAVSASMPYTLREEFPSGETLCGYHDELQEFLNHLFERMLLDDETKKLKSLMLALTKLSGLVKYAGQKILLAGVHQAVGVYWIERKISKTPLKQAEDAAICEFWKVAIYRAVNIVNRE